MNYKKYLSGKFTELTPGHPLPQGNRARAIPLAKQSDRQLSSNALKVMR
jgi:hypothetical protein